MVSSKGQFEAHEQALPKGLAESALTDNRLTGESQVGGKLSFMPPGSDQSVLAGRSIVIPELFPPVITGEIKTASARFDFKPGESRYLHFPRLDKSAAGPQSTTEKEILANTRSHVGQQVWKGHRYADRLDAGKLADCASVSEILKASGYDYADSANEGNLVGQLMNNGWRLVGVKEARPGDVIYGGKLGTNWKVGTANAAIGIVGEDGKVYRSDSATGKLTLVDSTEAFGAEFGDQVYVLRPPSSRTTRQPVDSFRPQADNGSSEVPRTGNPVDSASPVRWEADRGDRVADRDNPDPQTRPGDHGSDYWREYWKSYWKNYWQEYFRQGSGDRSRERGERIYQAARQMEGKPVWQGYRYANITENGRLGSAASVSEVLRASGFSYAGGPNVATLARTLLSRGWKPVAVNGLRPGDVIYGAKAGDWQNGGGNAQVGIVGEDGLIYANDPATGLFRGRRAADVFQPGLYGNRIWALRVPAQDAYIPADQNYGQNYRQDYRSFQNPIQGLANIANVAMANVGRQLWTFIRGVGANLGCAASVSAVLDRAGYHYARNAAVGGLEGQLLSNGWQKLPVSMARPGDVVIGARTPYYRQGGGGSHIGVVGYNGRVYHNSSRSGQWSQADISYYAGGRFRYGSWVLRPPGQTV
ncbi:MAG: hypothetical protein KC777_16745 [Cyanobacteria bacterium HKST-UBA02]|nr:hypothetical protein [Cyanobacteria bacterium HKST-UBA02]